MSVENAILIHKILLKTKQNKNNIQQLLLTSLQPPKDFQTQTLEYIRKLNHIYIWFFYLRQSHSVQEHYDQIFRVSNSIVPREKKKEKYVNSETAYF